MIKTKRAPIIAMLLLLPVAFASTTTMAIDADWQAGSGLFSQATNWNVPAVPCNTDFQSFDVTIPAGSGTVTQDLPICNVNSFNLGAGRGFVINTTEFSSPVSVLSGATTIDSGVFSSLTSTNIGGNVSCTAGQFTAAGATFSGAPALAATSGGAIDIDAPAYNSSGFSSSRTLMNATGPGSVINLPLLTDLNAGFNGNTATQAHTVTASNGGVLNASSLMTLTGPLDDEDRLDVIVDADAQIDLTSLKTVTSVGLGRVRLIASNGAQITLPQLETVSRGVFSASGGALIAANQTPWTFSSTGLDYSLTILSASGAGSELDFGALTDINAGFNGNSATQVHTIAPTGGSTIDLSSVTRLVGPLDDEDRLDVLVDSTNQIDLSSLANVTGVGLGRVRFVASNDAQILLPALETVVRGIFSATDGSLIAANQLPWTYSSAGMDYSQTILSASGNGAALDFSALTDINAGFNGNSATQIHTISPSDNGVIDLSNVTRLVGPLDDEDRLDVVVNGNSQIDLSSLDTVTGVGLGRVFFSAANAAQIALPQLQTVVRGIFAASSGSVITANQAPWTYASSGMDYTQTLLSATGAGSLLDFSALTEINASFNGNTATQVHNVSASDSGHLDLSRITRLVGPLDDEDRLDVASSTGGTIDLSGLSELAGSLGFVRLIAGIDSTLIVGRLDRISGTGPRQLILSENSTVIAPNSLLPPLRLTVTASAGATLNIDGDLSFNKTNESDLNLEVATVTFDGTGSQTLEVGGFNIGPTEPIGLNFAIGQLIVGDADTAAELRLLDAQDNGNGHGLCSNNREALYLLGINGSDEDGLRLLGGSVLRIDNIPVYAHVDGSIVQLNSLATPGVPLPFDQGTIEFSGTFDMDGDGVADDTDNCVATANADQRDTDGDGYGNICDADLNNDLIVNVVDLGLLRSVFFSNDPDADFNGNGIVNVEDLGILRKNFFAPPGPSCVGAN